MDCSGISQQMFMSLKYCASVPLEGNAVEFDTALAINGSLQCKFSNPSGY
jgi:hypothetical protein